ncbi:hypothetical protein BC939DRAFT_51264 [Gamsiella multidivaricata]|uniref:uncharacterized protein n=1 Tax=Gamsiella multidivaricata TaxID=101098 RepID=UPI00221F5839|nr:uncharacterized protein BC939DRAFT_51264 [Gamsiella multidivaricata]KAI7828826.1 hypothetical protein BC939DRAFT_51264 [Gamsiella multidivaricata]
MRLPLLPPLRRVVLGESLGSAVVLLVHNLPSFAPCLLVPLLVSVSVFPALRSPPYTQPSPSPRVRLSLQRLQSPHPPLLLRPQWCSCRRLPVLSDRVAVRQYLLFSSLQLPTTNTNNHAGQDASWDYEESEPVTGTKLSGGTTQYNAWGAIIAPLGTVRDSDIVAGHSIGNAVRGHLISQQ